MTNSTTYLLYNIKIFKYTSMYNISRIRSGPLRFLLYSSRIIYNLLILFLIYGTLMYLKEKGLDEFESSVMVYFYLCITAFFRLNYFYAYGPVSESIVRKMNEIFIYTTRTGLEEKDMKHQVLLSNKYVPFYVLYIMVFGVGYHVIPVIITYVFRGEKELPITVYCPYNCKTSPLFELTVFMQIVMNLEIVFSVIGPDLFFWNLLYLTSRQFELLGWELKNSLYTTLLHNGLEKNLVLNFSQHLGDPSTNGDFSHIYDIIDTQEFTMAYIKKIGELIRFHNSLVKFCEDVNNLFSPVILAWCILVIFLTMICGFLFLVTNNIVVLTIGLTHCVTFMFVLLWVCVLAELVKMRSEQLQDILYSLEWYSCRREFKKVFLILMLGVSKPVKFTVGKFANLNLAVFVWTIKTTFSYFTVMRRIMEIK